MVAAVLAERGLDVVVLEAAGYFNESDFTQLELPAYQQMFWRGGPTPDRRRQRQPRRRHDARRRHDDQLDQLPAHPPLGARAVGAEHGLEGVDGPDFDRHLDAVLRADRRERRCSDLNGPQQRMKEGAEALGWSFETIVRNADPD